MDSLEEKILLELGDLKRENDSLKATNERLIHVLNKATVDLIAIAGDPVYPLDIWKKVIEECNQALESTRRKNYIPKIISLEAINERLVAALTNAKVSMERCDDRQHIKRHDGPIYDVEEALESTGREG